jgi:hypothetical protein
MVRTVVHTKGDQTADPYQAKLLKYVPAEVLGGFIPLAQLADGLDKDVVVWGVGIVGLLATPPLTWLCGRAVAEMQLRDRSARTEEDTMWARFVSELREVNATARVLLVPYATRPTKWRRFLSSKKESG